MYTTLADAYGPQQWWPAKTSLEVIVGAYLTQNTSWRAVEKSIENLRASGVLNLEGLRAISEEELQILIKPSGFMQRKASSIKAFIPALALQSAKSSPIAKPRLNPAWPLAITRAI